MNTTINQIKDKFNEKNNQIDGVVIDQSVKEALDNKVSNEAFNSSVQSINSSLDNKVDKDGDKVLSTHDFTTALKAKLDGLTNYDDTELTSKLNELESNLNTILNDENATTVIDTFQEIENFLQGITNTETLTGLLQDLKSDIIGLCNSSYLKSEDLEPVVIDEISMFILYYIASENDNYYSEEQTHEFIDTIIAKAKEAKDNNRPLRMSIIPDEETGESLVDINCMFDVKQVDGYTGVMITCILSNEVWSLQVDSAYSLTCDLYRLENISSNPSDILDKIKEVDGVGSGLDADLLDGKHDGELAANRFHYFGSISDANNVPQVNGIYTVGTETPLNFPYDSSLYGILIQKSNRNQPISGGASHWIFQTFYKTESSNEIWQRSRTSAQNWTPWRKIAYTDSNVASADKLTTKQLTNEDLNNIKDVNFSTYFGIYTNTCANKPDSVNGFNLVVYKMSSDCIKQILYDVYDKCYIRNYNASKQVWSSWKKMLTEDDIQTLTQSEYDALTTKNSNTIYLIKE